MHVIWQDSIGFIGAGAVGSALALALHALDYPVTTVYSKGGESARTLAAQLPGCEAAACPQQVADRCGVVFICTPDDVITPVAEAVAWRQGQEVLHCAGGASVALLAPAQHAGAHIGGFHPFQTFPRRSLPAAIFQGITFGIQAEGVLLDRLQHLAMQLGGNAPVILCKEDDRALYHASAVMACGAVTALLGAASGLWESMSVPHPQSHALKALMPLLRGTVEALATQSGPGALTGPVARGDVGTVRRHVEALQTHAPGTIALYSQLGLAQIPMALARGTCSRQAAAAMERILNTALARHARGGTHADDHSRRTEDESAGGKDSHAHGL